MYVDYREVGRRIAARRRALGLKQNKVNEMAELSDKYLSNIETARSIPSIDVLMRICKALDTTPDYILLGAVCENEKGSMDKLIAETVSQMPANKQRLVFKFAKMIEDEEI